MTTLKRTVTIALSILMLASTVTSAMPMNVQRVEAASKATKNRKKAIKAYTELLNGSKIEVSNGDFVDVDDDLSFALNDMNNDGVPELIVDTMIPCGMRCCQVMYTFHKGKAVVNDFVSYGGFSSFDKGSVYMVERARFGEWTRDYYKIKGGDSVCVASGDNSSSDESYLINDKNVSKKKFLAFVKRNTKNSKATIVDKKMHKVTSANIKKYLR